jgi:hypothetical protein
MVGEIEHGEDNLALLGHDVIAVLSRKTKPVRKAVSLFPPTKP